MTTYEWQTDNHHGGGGFTDEEMELADRAARRHTGQWAEYDDLRQECLIWFVENEGTWVRWQEEGNYEHKVRASLANHCKRYIMQEKAARSGYSPEDQFFYSIGMVNDLMPLIFGEPDVLVNNGQTEAKPPANPQENNNLQAMIADIKVGYEALSDADKLMLGAVFDGGDPRRNLADEAAVLGISRDAMDKRVRRALGRLRKPLGGRVY